MSFASYTDFLEQISRLLDGDDVSVSDVPVASLQNIIGLAERRVYREVRSRHNEKAFSGVTATSNLAPIPADYQSASVVHFGDTPMIPASEEYIRAYLACGASGAARYFADAGGSFIFGPAVSDGTAVQGRYFYRHPDMTAANFSSNALIANEPDVVLYACLAEGAPLYGLDPARWEAKYLDTVARINTERERGAYSAGGVRVRSSTRLMG